MEDFLVNKHHDLFSNKQLSYKIFLCKDCSKKKKEYIHQETDHKPCNILRRMLPYKQEVSQLSKTIDFKSDFIIGKPCLFNPQLFIFNSEIFIL